MLYSGKNKIYPYLLRPDTTPTRTDLLLSLINSLRVLPML